MKIHPRLRRLASVGSRFLIVGAVSTLIEIGAYVPGTNPTVDRATALMPRIDAFLRQGTEESEPLDEAWALLHEVVGA